MHRYRQRDEVLKDMGFSSYDEYLSSPLWKELRKRLFDEQNVCPCGKRATEVHHRSYKRRCLEGRGNICCYLTPICRECHLKIEFDGTNKTPLAEANSRLDQIAADGPGIKFKKRKRRKKRRSSDLLKSVRRVKTRNKPQSPAARQCATQERRNRRLLKANSTKKKCRCCLQQRHLGRDDICLPCYKRHRRKVHLIAERNDRNTNQTPAGRETAST